MTRDDPSSRDLPLGDAAFFEMSLDHLCVAGLDGYFKRVSPSWTRTLGWTEDELLSRPSLEFVHPDDRPAVLAARDGLKLSRPLLNMANRYLCKDGSYRWFEWRSVSDVDRGLIYAVARDVTEQRQAELALRDVTDHLSTVLNSLADGVIATDEQGAVRLMNPIAAKLTGWSVSEARGRPLHEVLDLVTDVDVDCAKLLARALRRELAAGFACEAQLVARDGTRLPISITWSPMAQLDAAVSGAVLVVRDLTRDRAARDENAQLQKQLLFADRMASIGTLAGGLAHEINNPLAFVIANLDMLIEELRPGNTVTTDQVTEWADLAVANREGAERIKTIVRGLKRFSRAEDARVERLAITELMPVLELAADMAFQQIRHRAQLVKVYGATPPVQADDTRLGQVFLNLLLNAAQAIPEGAASTNEIRVVTSTAADGRAVVEVLDTGAGIPAPLITRIFDPFFTTKPVGVGTGLGLWICHDIITGLGGELTAKNRPDGGACFRIVLPSAPDRIQQVGATGAAPPTAPRRAAVLIVDDEPAVGAALRRVLREHDVTVLTSGQAALDLLLSGPDFDVIFSDLMMPNVSGMALHDQLAKSRPELALRMIFITGGAFTPAGKAFLERIPNERMEKPFNMALVRAVVRRMVG